MSLYPDIRTYGRIRGRNAVRWPFDYLHPPSWFHPLQALRPEDFPVGDRVIMEVGFGMGDSLDAMAQSHLDWQFVGVEIYEPGVLRLAQLRQSGTHQNLTIIQGDVFNVLDRYPASSVARIHVFFPDPWPKLRHHKRRLHRGRFFEACARVLQPSGRIHLATDVPEYADDWCLHAPKHWRRVEEDPWVEHRIQTKYEHRGRRLGHEICDVVLAVE